MTIAASEWPGANTQHGMLVALGEFLRQHGLIERLMNVPIPQKTRHFPPQTKLVEFLAGIVSGLEHLEDLNTGPRPLVHDRVVAQAWGQSSFAHYSSVSRTLDACNDATVAAVEQAIEAFSRPFLATTIQDLLRRGEPIIFDFDLTGQAVSSTSKTYPDVAFGWMNDGVKLGYQLARVCLSPQDGERIWLAGFHHPGDAASVKCLKELVRAAEAQAHVRPRRRTELVQQRIETQQVVVARAQRLVSQQAAKLTQLQATQVEVIGKLYHVEQTCTGPISPEKLARLQTQRNSWLKRQPRLAAQIVQCQQVLAKHRAQMREQEMVLTDLGCWLAQLEADNQRNPEPPPYVEARMDAGFVSGENLTWLLELGYCPNTKAPNDRTTTALHAQLSAETRWVPVGANADMVAWDNYYLHGCPFPLTVALERFKVGSTCKYATLIHYRDDGLFPTLPVWFQNYNARQTIEAGNKEIKGTFFVQHLMSRSKAGIRLQVLFTGLAANTVRWCGPWLKACAAQLTPPLLRALKSPKHLVHVAANAAAFVQQQIGLTALHFAPDSPFPGVILFLKGVPAFQLAFGFNQPFRIASG